MSLSDLVVDALIKTNSTTRDDIALTSSSEVMKRRYAVQHFGSTCGHRRRFSDADPIAAMDQLLSEGRRGGTHSRSPHRNVTADILWMSSLAASILTAAALTAVLLRHEAGKLAGKREASSSHLAQLFRVAE